MIYLDNHSTTRVDPDVIAAMLPTFTEEYANPGSTTHEFGRTAATRVKRFGCSHGFANRSRCE